MLCSHCVLIWNGMNSQVVCLMGLMCSIKTWKIITVCVLSKHSLLTLVKITSHSVTSSCRKPGDCRFSSFFLSPIFSLLYFDLSLILPSCSQCFMTFSLVSISPLGFVVLWWTGEDSSWSEKRTKWQHQHILFHLWSCWSRWHKMMKLFLKWLHLHYSLKSLQLPAALWFSFFSGLAQAMCCVIGFWRGK